jgi:hypothetical protein
MRARELACDDKSQNNRTPIVRGLQSGWLKPTDGLFDRCLFVEDELESDGAEASFRKPALQLPGAGAFQCGDVEFFHFEQGLHDAI